jgi:hypothetical protein
MKPFFVTQERFFSNPEFLEDLRDLYRLRQVLEDEGICEKLVKKPKLPKQRKQAINQARQTI